MSAPVSTAQLVEAAGIASLAAVSYVSTNMDNLVLLSAYSAKPGTRPLFIRLTFVCVCLAVLLVSLGLARAADTLPAVDLRYLGLIPMSLGAWQAIQLFRGRGREDDGGGEPDKGAGPATFAAYCGFASFSWPTAATASAS